MLRRYKLKNYNFRLVILLIAISIIGVLLIGSADSADQKKTGHRSRIGRSHHDYCLFA